MTTKIIFTLLIILSINKLFSQDKVALQSWHNNKYSMFIHFGVYSELGGVWNGVPSDNGYSEQIQARAGIFADIYAQVPSRFNPEKWNADSIVCLAKKAGMRSIVITTKHHDGFCMFKTATTRYNIVEATPFKRDVMKELAEVCKKEGLNLGFYFSLIDYTLHPSTSHNANPITADHHEYNKKQVAELLTNYGPISELWFDMGSLTVNQSREMYNLVHRLQPNCLVSGRLGNDAYDFCVMGDNEYPDYKIDAPWQTPASIFNETWGYRSWQKRENVEGKIHEKLLSLIKVVSRGGNYLLNIGPKADGTIPAHSLELLSEVGKWMKVNGEAIYGTGKWTIRKEGPNSLKMKGTDDREKDGFNMNFNNEDFWFTQKGKHLYAISLANPKETAQIKSLDSKIGQIKNVEILGKGKVKFEQCNDGLKVPIPSNFAPKGGYVIKVELK